MLDKDLFFKIYNHKVLKNIIFENISVIHVKHLGTIKQYKWDEVIQDPFLLIYYNYIEELKKLPISKLSIQIKGKDLLFYATTYGRYEIILYLTTLPKLKSVEWKYIDALVMTPLSETPEIFNYILSNINLKEYLKESNGRSPILSIGSCLKYAALKKRMNIIDTILDAMDTENDDISNIIYDYLVEGTIMGGHIDLLDYCIEKSNIDIKKINAPLLEYCANFKQLEMLKYLHELGVGESHIGEGITNAVEVGDLDMVKWFYTNYETTFYKSNLLLVAARVGNLEIFKWLHDICTEQCLTKVMDVAAQKGKLEVIKWLHSNCTVGCTTKAMNQAASKGRLETVKWLHSNRTEGCTTDAMDYAAKNMHLDVVKWLHENRTEGCTTNAMDWSAEFGHLSMVMWLHFNRTEGCTTDAMDCASEFERIEIVKWLHENRTEGCTDYALENTYSLEGKNWLLENRTEF